MEIVEESKIWMSGSEPKVGLLLYGLSLTYCEGHMNAAEVGLSA